MRTWREMVKQEFGYEAITTFWEDFSIADAFGTAAVQDTFNRAFNEWRGNYKYLTELVMVLNHKMCIWYKENKQLAMLYNQLYEQAAEYAVTHLQGDEFTYYYQITD